MTCDVPEDQLLSWIDREAPELEEHLAGCRHCRARAQEYRAPIQTIAAGPPQDIEPDVGACCAETIWPATAFRQTLLPADGRKRM